MMNEDISYDPFNYSSSRFGEGDNIKNDKGGLFVTDQLSDTVGIDVKRNFMGGSTIDNNIGEGVKMDKFKAGFKKFWGKVKKGGKKVWENLPQILETTEDILYKVKDGADKLLHSISVRIYPNHSRFHKKQGVLLCF